MSPAKGIPSSVIPSTNTTTLVFKSELKKEKKTFNYQVYEDTGNDDVRHFSVKLSIDDKIVAKARATSKKKAEEKASKRAFFVFQSRISKMI